MARGSRGGNAPPVSLFSFQDIMTCLIGIMLLVVMILALSSTSGSPPPPSPVDPCTELAKRETAAMARIDAARERSKSDPSPTMADIAAMRAELVSLYDRVRTTEGRLTDEFERASGAVAKDGENAKAVQELRSLEAKVEEARATLDEIRRNHTLTYIARQGYDKQPVLIEIAEPQWRFAQRPGASAALTAVDRPGVDRIAAMRSALTPYPPAEHYILLIVKPSSADEAFDVCKALSDAGYSLGIDLLPEDWTSLVRTGGAP